MTEPCRSDLAKFTPHHDSFVGIDSDGCVFDTMEIKQKQCFHGLIISHWHLNPVETLVRETAEFVNLYSCSRGQNRFLSLVQTFDLLRERPEVQKSGVAVPHLPELRTFIDSGAPLSNAGLQAAVDSTGNEELVSLLEWSLDVNDEVARKVKRIPPFPWALEGIKRIHAGSDAICVSQTPLEALCREWDENGLTGYVAAIAGQEHGTKTEHLQQATAGRYASGRILMIGDAPGDERAARANNALFYPINPGHEDASWERFCKEAHDRFLSGRYAGAYQDALVAEFDALLPDTPPWRRGEK